MNTLVQKLPQLFEQKCDHVVVTLVEINGSAPQVVGSKMIIDNTGRLIGTIGGGKIEAHSIEYATEILKLKAKSELKCWNLQTDIKMSCGGSVKLFFDSMYFSHWTIAIFGAGHISQELCRVLQTWSCQVQVYDTRSEWIEKLPRSFNISAKLTSDMGAEVHQLPENSYLLSMTQGHRTDLPILLEAYKRESALPFLGVIGSEIKATKIKKELAEHGVATDRLAELKSPLGLPIGNNTPPEIAISIASQLLMVRDGVKAVF